MHPYTPAQLAAGQTVPAPVLHITPTGSDLADDRLLSIRNFVLACSPAEAVRVLAEWQERLGNPYHVPKGEKPAGWAIVVSNVVSQLGSWQSAFEDAARVGGAA